MSDSAPDLILCVAENRVELVDAMHALEDLDGITPFINNVTDATITIETPL